MATKFVGLNPSQTRTLTSDFTEAGRLCMVAVNSLIVNPQMQINQRPQELLRLAFHISSGDSDFDDEVQTIKNTFLVIPSRANQLTVSRDTSPPTGASNTIEFLAFTKNSEANSIFLRDGYFSLAQRERALTLIHESVHLIYPANFGDGHPGGVVIMFAEGDVGIDYDNASKNPYCYQYFVDWLH
ncbi:MAG: hypothetical protein ABSA78_09050 [Candidatus Sulfotelmatobacter sp.]